MYLHLHLQQSIVPKGRSFTGNSGTMPTVLLKGTQAAVLLEMDRCSSCPLLSTPPLPLASEQTLKDLKRSQGHQHGGEGSGFG